MPNVPLQDCNTSELARASLRSVPPQSACGRGGVGAAEEFARGEGREDGHTPGGEHAADHPRGGLLAEAGVDVAELAPLQGLHADEPHEARLQRRHRRREHHVRAPLHKETHRKHQSKISQLFSAKTPAAEIESTG
jgi:hypothetical protein